MKTIQERKALFELRGQSVFEKKGLLWITLFDQKSLVCFILDVSYKSGMLIGKTTIERMVKFSLRDLIGRTIAWQTMAYGDCGQILFLEEQPWFKKAMIKL